MKITWCHSRLAIGSTGKADLCLNTLTESKVTHVINCRCDPNFSEALRILVGIVVLNNPVNDDGKSKLSSWFHLSIDFALCALASPRHKVCVVCCEGNNRSPSTALAILMAQGIPFTTALTFVRSTRPCARILYSEDARRAVEILGYA